MNTKLNKKNFSIILKDDLIDLNNLNKSNKCIRYKFHSINFIENGRNMYFTCNKNAYGKYLLLKFSTEFTFGFCNFRIYGYQSKLFNYF